MTALPTPSTAAASVTRLLIVDDDPDIRDLLAAYLGDYGYEVDKAGNGDEMHALMHEHHYQLLVLDLMLPGEDGLSLCRNLRQQSDLPVIMLTARGDPLDRVIGLEMGADDYLPKPFEPRELVARIQTVLRRSRNGAKQKQDVAPIAYRFAGWHLSVLRRQLTTPSNMVVPLSNAEFRLLMVFLDAPHRVLSRDLLLDLARGRSIEAFDRSIDLLVSRVRQKLSDDPREPKLIKTIRGEGYVFDAEVVACAD
ncbi:two-component system, OmpR family, response regulator [Andreprevotia lacus DSM 23236]|uniref:Two-component system, OmpR family, response regulator n=1 Tax=Andreprevotia lacus DSM 23236 TaxID=1121001 RepID=A0A1W1Y0L3_9NEIS|nr:response regulator [Andreprevotia lacus]SMC29749.1 two-component system, OmpR family, response regulator [Andreprevotia lacus DSM 23236]